MNRPALAAADTLSERAFARIEADIVSGALGPGVRLGIADMAERYQVGATPLREALSRLVARGLVDAIGQRGFRVKGISQEDLEDIVRLRTLIEGEALRLSMERGGGDWEARIVASLHQLRHYVRSHPRGFAEGDPEFDGLHKSFHTALLDACGSPRMIAAHSDLYDQAYRYRRLMMAGFADREAFLAEHDRLAGLAIRREHEEGRVLLAQHIASTLRHVYPDFPEASAP